MSCAATPPGCKTSISGTTRMFGAPLKATDVFVDHTAQWQRFGDITKVNVYYRWACLSLKRRC
jgi:hypothetical protein